MAGKKKQAGSTMLTNIADKASEKSRAYELMVILKPLLPEDVRNKLLAGMTDVITKLDGKIELKDSWGKRHMAYKIKGHEEGYYIVYKVELPAGAAFKVQQEMKLMSDILRFVLLDESEL
jgi:small subunit ribosomal protein S6